MGLNFGNALDKVAGDNTRHYHHMADRRKADIKIPSTNLSAGSHMSAYDDNAVDSELLTMATCLVGITCLRARSEAVILRR